GHRLHEMRHLAYYFVGFAFTITPGKAGEAVRAVYLKPYGVHYMQSMAALFMERLLDLLVIAALATLVLGNFPKYHWLIGLMLGLILLVTWLLNAAVPVIWARRLEIRMHVRQLGQLLRHIADMLEASTILRRNRSFTLGVVVGLLAWGAEGLALYFIIHWLGADIGLLLALGIYGLSMLAGAISFMPGGLGGTEVAMGLLLSLAGVETDIAIATTIVCRLTTLWFAVALGILAAVIVGTTPPHRPK
ncbi:MAG: lysylphosphatidylglycerol synthase transmembrane domain-containing protein, partial [Nevskiales bacterium]